MISLLVCTAVALASADAAPTHSPRADEVARLVGRLDASRLDERDQAERKLVDMGAAVLPLLPTIAQRTPAEVAERLARIQQKLLTAQARHAAEPSLVTLKGTDLPLSEVFAAIAHQTGNPIVDHRQAFGEVQTAARVKVDFDKMPFWRAMDQVLDQADLTVYGFAGERGAFIVNRPDGASPRGERAFYAGVFRVAPLRFEALRDLANERERSLKLFVDVTWEPRLQPIAILQPRGQVSATGDDGQAIAAANSEAEPEALIRSGISATELEIPLALPKRSVDKIRSLKGRLLALVPGPPHDFHFNRLAVTGNSGAMTRVEQRRAGATVTIDHVRKNVDGWEVGMRVKFDAPSNALESHRGWILDNEAYFQNAAGRRIMPGGFEQTRQNRDEIGITYLFDLPEGPEHLDFVYRTPVTILELGVDYEFRDLPLP